MEASTAERGGTGLVAGHTVLARRGAADIASRDLPRAASFRRGEGPRTSHCSFTRNPVYLQSCQFFFVFLANAGVRWSQSGMRPPLRPQSATFVVAKWGIRERVPK